MRTSLLLSILCAALAVACGAARPRDAEASAGSTAAEIVKVGDSIPAFVMGDETGAEVRFPGATRRPTVLVFYRGSWCPYCVRQLGELRELRKTDDSFDLYAISIDSSSKSATLAKRIAGDGRGPLGFRLLSDPDHKLIDALGLHDGRYDGSEYAGIPRAATLVVNTKGVVTWLRVSDDYKIRPATAEIRAEVEKAN